MLSRLLLLLPKISISLSNMIAPITTTMKSTNAIGCMAGLVFCFLLHTIMPANARNIKAPYTNTIIEPLFL